MSPGGLFELDKLSRWDFQARESLVIGQGFVVEQPVPDLVKILAIHDDRFLPRAVPCRALPALAEPDLPCRALPVRGVQRPLIPGLGGTDARQARHALEKAKF